MEIDDGGELMVLAFWLCFLPCNALEGTGYYNTYFYLVCMKLALVKRNVLYCTTKLDTFTEVLGETRALQGRRVKSLKPSIFFVFIKQ